MDPLASQVAARYVWPGASIFLLEVLGTLIAVLLICLYYRRKKR